MKNILLFCALMLTFPIFAQICVDKFKEPTADVRPSTYWEWMNGNISKEGITEDLKYMKSAGYGSAMIFEASVGIPRGSVDYYSEDWIDMVKHALTEAEKLGMTIDMHNSPGYSGTGGRWITPDVSMKQVVWSDVVAETDKKGNISVDMPSPITKLGFYKDIKVLAYRLSDANVQDFKKSVKSIKINGKKIDDSVFKDYNLATQLRLDKGDEIDIELFSPQTLSSSTIFRGDREIPLDPHDGPRDYAPVLSLYISEDGKDYCNVGNYLSSPLRELDAPSTITFPSRKAKRIKILTNRSVNIAEIDFHPTQRIINYTSKNNSINSAIDLSLSSQIIDNRDIINLNDIVDVTEYMDSNGRIRWKPSSNGVWNIVRIGYTTTAEKVAAAPDSGIGLECDKLSKRGVDAHYSRFLEPLLSRLKPWCGKTLRSLVIDSWEAGKQNWTEELPEEFYKSRGYDITPWLLCVTGRIVGDVGTTERFLWDFRRTHADMFLSNYICHFRDIMHNHGLTYAGEAYGDGTFESLEMAAMQDIPMSEYWTHYIYGNVMTTMMASSVAHIYDKEIVGCEIFTGTPFNSKFTEHPYGMKAMGDFIMTQGVNKFVYHATTHQPYVGPTPGTMMTMGPFGTHLDRMSTWAHLFRPFNDYVSRCSYLLREGRYVADVLYIKDAGISSGVKNHYMHNPVCPYGYSWDITDPSSFVKMADSSGDTLVMNNVMRYRVLVVEDLRRASSGMIHRLIDLVKSGVCVILPDDRPYGGLGLDKEEDALVASLADRLYSMKSDNLKIGSDIKSALDELKIKPDFTYASDNRDASINFIHRQEKDNDIYFVANQLRRPERFIAEFRVTGKEPRLWNAETGESDLPVEYNVKDGKTLIDLTLENSGSVFIVFKPTDNPVYSNLRNTGNTSACLDSVCDNFTISFWAKPETFSAAGRGFVVIPAVVEGKAAVGVSVGQNGVSVYERSKGNMPVIKIDKNVEGWSHIAVSYKDNIPSLYINGEFTGKGNRSEYSCVPSVGMPIRHEDIIAVFEGDNTEPVVRKYPMTQSEIQAEFNKGLPEPVLPAGSKNILSVDKDWTVSFPEWSGAPLEARMPKLESLHRNENFNIRHFSGTAVYTTTFELDSVPSGSLSIDLGRVENIAEISVNGSEFITLWKAPYITSVTRWLKPGINSIEIRVTNLYPNRLIGDEYYLEKYDYDSYGRLKKFPDWYLNNEADISRERVLFVPWKYYKKTDPLLESGLLGPVRIINI